MVQQLIFNICHMIVNKMHVKYLRGNGFFSAAVGDGQVFTAITH